MLKQMARGKICTRVALVRHSYGSRYKISIDIDWFFGSDFKFSDPAEDSPEFKRRRKYPELQKPTDGIDSCFYLYELNWALSYWQ